MVKEKVVKCRECGNEFNIYTRPAYRRMECSEACRENWLNHQGKPMDYKEEIKRETIEYKPIPVNETNKVLSGVFKAIGGICIIVAIIALWGMAGDFIEFSAYLSELRQGVPDYLWNDPQIQAVINEGYAKLAEGPLTVAIPMIVITVILFIASAAVKRAGSPKRVEQLTPMTQ